MIFQILHSAYTKQTNTARTTKHAQLLQIFQILKIKMYQYFDNISGISADKIFVKIGRKSGTIVKYVKMCKIKYSSFN